MKLIVNSAERLAEAHRALDAAWQEHKYQRLTLQAGRDRSIEQNDQSHVWYAQIAKELRENNPLGVKAECKLTIGVPILRAEDAEFRAFYNAALLHLTYEQKIKAMEYVPVTSTMRVAQMSQYLVTMQDRYRDRGVVLEFQDSE